MQATWLLVTSPRPWDRVRTTSTAYQAVYVLPSDVYSPIDSKHFYFADDCLHVKGSPITNDAATPVPNINTRHDSACFPKKTPCRYVQSCLQRGALSFRPDAFMKKFSFEGPEGTKVPESPPEDTEGQEFRPDFPIRRHPSPSVLTNP